MNVKEILSRRALEASRDEIEAHCELMPGRYFQQYSPAEMSLHVRMIHRLLRRLTGNDSEATLAPEIEWQEDPDRGLAGVHVVTWDRAGLFSKMAGSMTVAGLDIVTAKAYVREDHIVVVTFYVPDAAAAGMEERRTVFEDMLRQSLSAESDRILPMVAAATEEGPPKEGGAAVRTGPTPAVYVYRELSLPRAIVEVEAPDRAGLLYRLSGLIFEHDYNITFARVGTEQGMARDVFYIEPTEPGAVSVQNLQRLRKVLLAATSIGKGGPGAGKRGTEDPLSSPVDSRNDSTNLSRLSDVVPASRAGRVPPAG